MTQVMNARELAERLVKGAIAANLDISEDLLIDLEACGNLDVVVNAILTALRTTDREAVLVERAWTKGYCEGAHRPDWRGSPTAGEVEALWIKSKMHEELAALKSSPTDPVARAVEGERELVEALEKLCGAGPVLDAYHHAMPDCECAYCRARAALTRYRGEG